jgi:hypothetical protein
MIRLATIHIYFYTSEISSPAEFVNAYGQGRLGVRLCV